MTSTWLAYNDLAWTEEWLADPADYEAAVETYVDLLKSVAKEPLRTLLHLGSGAGGQDRFFKRHFAVTGVDLSSGMLNRARAAHPDVEYVQGDMRAVRLGRKFDAVIAPDCVDYMASLDDLRLAIETAHAHLEPGGILLMVASTAEMFRSNNFAYSGEKDGIQVTLFENNYVDPQRPDTYEATLVYLIRQMNQLTVHTDRHVLGLFSEATWRKALGEAGFSVKTTVIGGAYDKYLLGEGEHPLTAFVGQKTSTQHPGEGGVG